MKRHILARFRHEVVHRDLMLVRIGQIFDNFARFSWVHGVSVAAAGEGYDVEIALELEEDALAEMESAPPYRVWLAEFGPLLEKVETQNE